MTNQPSIRTPKAPKTYSIALIASEHTSATAAFTQNLLKHLTGEELITPILVAYYKNEKAHLEKAIATEQHAIFVAIDEESATMTSLLLQAAKSECALVFSCLTEPHDLIAHSTGLSTPIHEYAKQMAFVLSFMPTIHKVMIIFDEQDSIMTGIKNDLFSYLEKIEYHTIAFPHNPRLSRRETIHIATNDLVILLCQHPSPLYLERLSSVCTQHKSLLYITDTTAHGAALAFGKNEEGMAKKSAQLITSLLILGKDTLPAKGIEPYRLKINPQALEAQGISLHKVAPLLALIDSTTLISPTTHEKVTAYLRLEEIPIE